MTPIFFAKKATFVSVAIAILLSGLSACSKHETSVTLVADAKQLLQKGDSKGAVIQLKNAVQSNPEDAEARLALGTLYNDLGDNVSAEKELRKAQALGLPKARVLPGLANALAGQQQFQTLLTETESPEAQANLDIVGLRGDAFLAIQQPDKAKQAYDLVLASQAHNTHALVGLARHCLSQRDIECANRISDQAVTSNPNDPDAWIFKGDLLRALGKADESIAAYDKVLALKPAHRTAHIEKAYAEIGSRKFDAAAADLEAARKITPNNLIITYTQALLDFTQGKLPAAKESILKVLRVAPDHMPTVLLAGAIEVGLGSPQQAEKHLRKYLEKNPKNNYARKLLVGTLTKLGQAQEAATLLSPMLATEDKDPEMFALAGEAAMQTRDYAKAAAYFERATALAPNAARVRTALAMSKLAQGDSDRAVSELEQSTKLDAKSVQSGSLLVLTELRLKHFDKAQAAIKTLEAAQPTDPVVQNLKGGVYMAKDDVVNARASFERAITLQPAYVPAVINLAQLSLKEKKPEEAKQRLLAFLEVNKKNVEVMSFLAKLAENQNKPEEVLMWRERASNENPDAVAPALQLGMLYLRTGQAQKSLTLLRKLQVANPQNPDVLSLLGQAQLGTNELPGALETYNKLAGVAPKSGLPHFRLAMVHMAMKNPTAAMDDLKKAVSIEPELMEAQFAMAELAGNSGKFDQAMAIAKSVQQMHPKLAAGFTLEGNIQIAQHKPALAKRPFEQAYAITKEPAQFIKLHGLMRAMGQDKEAAALLAQWQALHPADQQVMLYQAEIDLASKQYKAASDRLEAVLKQNPNSAAALNNLAWAYQQQQDPRALKTAEQANGLAPDNPAIMDTLGWLLVEKGDLKRALPLLQKAVGLAPQAPDIRYHLAFGLNKSGDKAGARKELEQVVAAKNYAQIEQARALLKSL
ncbi:MAG: XrtA/PEP-CTERM system TPR-repeat protein PrsT [Pseudomonadota bacterium]